MTALKKRNPTANADRQGRHSLDRLVRRLGLDRRKRYCVWGGVLCTHEKFTDDCSGCTDCGDYGSKYGPYGCRECGYTGKRVVYFPDPVTVNGDFVTVSPNERDHAQRRTL